MVQSPIYPRVVRKNLRVVYIFLSFYCNLAYLFLWLSVVISTCEMLLSVREVRLNIPGEMFYQRKSSRARRSLRKSKRFSASISQRELSKSRRWSEEVHPEILPIKEKSLSALPSEEVIGIITMEDVIEELLKVKKMFPLVSKFFYFYFCHTWNWYSFLGVGGDLWWDRSYWCQFHVETHGVMYSWSLKFDIVRVIWTTWWNKSFGNGLICTKLFIHHLCNMSIPDPPLNFDF